MRRTGKKVLALAVATLLSSSAWAQSPTDWPEPNNYGGAKYSPLAQITPQNVSQLEVAWVYEIEPQPGSRGYNTTPIMVDNVMYFPKAQFTTITAINATTGEEIWATDLRKIPGLSDRTSIANRGISYWRGTAEHPPRIVLGTVDGFMVQLDAKTGKPIEGPAGVVNLSEGIMDKFGGAWQVGAPPAIYKNIAIFAGRTGEQGRYGIPGDPRGFDLITGKELWRFHVVPRPGEPNFGTWGLDGWQDRRGPGVWSPMTVDEENGLVFIPLGNATDQNFGGSRPGLNLYAGSLLVLHAETGELAWYFQHSRHDIFDWDTSAPPALLYTYPNGEPVPSVAQMTKQGLLFVFNRLTGEPIWGVEDRPVPAFDAPGDSAWPTQPFPIKPPPLARDSMDRDEVWTEYSEEHTKYCTELYDRSVQAGPHTPYGMLPSLVFPGSEGGGSWSGVAVDNERRLLFVNTRDLGVIAQLQSRVSNGLPSFGKSKIPTSFYVGPDGYPCQEPPWSRLFAIDTATGDIRWAVPVGEYEELTKRGITGTGTPNAAGGPLATAGGVVFIGASNDAKFRAFDALTGKELWSAFLDVNARATPMSYLGADGKQYVVAIAGGGDGNLDIPPRPPGIAKIVAFKLP
ncbi:MAG: PQQ-binding-like beta-propeller repeat protein [Gammaproteobacteria bacterium]